MRKNFLIRALALGLSFGALTALPNCYAETFAVSESATVNLNFDVSQGVEKTLTYDGRAVTFVAYENIFYVGKPVSDVQKLSVYIPVDYLRGGTINGYTAKTAPIFMPNGVGGYMPGKILEPVERDSMSGCFKSRACRGQPRNSRTHNRCRRKFCRQSSRVDCRLQGGGSVAPFQSRQTSCGRR